MQVLNKDGGVFDEDDEDLATALAAQCAVALQRARMTDALIESERMRQELEMAREVQMSTLPARMPSLAGYDVFGTSRPAEQTGGDTFDLMPDRARAARRAGRRDRARHRAGAVRDADAGHAADGLPARRRSRHGVPPRQRPARRDAARRPLHHRLHRRARSAFAPLRRSTAAGRARSCTCPAATGTCTRHRPTSFPLGAMPLVDAAPRGRRSRCSPGDVVLLLTDGVYEYDGSRRRGVRRGARRGDRPQPRSAVDGASSRERLLADVSAFARGAPQQDDVTMVLVGARAGARRPALRRTFEALPELVAFTPEFFAGQRIDPRPPGRRRLRDRGAVHEHGEVRQAGRRRGAKSRSAAHRGGRRGGADRL